jgi:hypothetical protein
VLLTSSQSLLPMLQELGSLLDELVLPGVLLL